MTSQPAVPTEALDSVDTARLDSVVTAFLDEMGAEVSLPDLAHDQCLEVSDLFVERCASAGVQAHTISGARFGEVPEFPGMRLLLTAHCAVQIQTDHGPVVYDWTARQFDPEVAVPLVQPLDQWRQEWAPL